MEAVVVFVVNCVVGDVGTEWDDWVDVRMGGFGNTKSGNGMNVSVKVLGCWMLMLG